MVPRLIELRNEGARLRRVRGAGRIAPERAADARDAQLEGEQSVARHPDRARSESVDLRHVRVAFLEYGGEVLGLEGGDVEGARRVLFGDERRDGTGPERSWQDGGAGEEDRGDFEGPARVPCYVWSQNRFEEVDFFYSGRAKWERNAK